MVRLRWLRLVGIVALILALYFVVPVHQDPRGGLVLSTLIAIVVLLALAALMVTQLRWAAADIDRRIDGLVGAIVAVLAVFALAFFSLELHAPGQVDGLDTRVDGLYFSASTMMTIGYGDVHATGQVARSLVLIQIAFDVVFVASAASLLTSRLRRAAQSRGGAGSRPSR